MTGIEIAVLGSSESWYFRDLTRAGAARGGCRLAAVPFTTLRASAGMKPSLAAAVSCPLAGDLASFGAVIVRTMPPGSLEQVVFRMNALAQLEAKGVAVINPPRSLEIAIDKYLTLTLLQQAGLLVPATCVCQSVEQAMEAFTTLGGDIVLKPVFGGEGRGVTRITDDAIALRVFKTLAPLGAVLYLQQFVPHHGYDYRLLVIGDEVLAMRRDNPDDWRTNVSRGATAGPLKLTSELRDIAIAAIRATGVQIAGVDVLPGKDGRMYAIEVNAVPGWKAAAKALNTDIAGRVLDYAIAAART